MVNERHRNNFRGSKDTSNKSDLSSEVSTKGDEELVALTLENQDYFLYIINRYREKLFRYIRRLSNVDEEEMEDILQDIFIKTYTNLNDFDKNLKFSSWIYRIAHNQVISHYRKTQARPQKAILDFDDDFISSIASDIDIAKDMDNKILSSTITKSIKRLDNKHKEILLLKYEEEKSYKEISDIIKKPMGTVASLMNRAKKELKVELEKKNLKNLNI